MLRKNVQLEMQAKVRIQALKNIVKQEDDVDMCSDTWTMQ